jgi:parallel beta-helix repeat protein
MTSDLERRRVRMSRQPESKWLSFIAVDFSSERSGNFVHSAGENRMTEHNMNPHNSSFNDRRAMIAGIGGLAAGAILTGRTQAGPLDPPTGPIAPTGKTLTEVEPRIAINSTNTPGDADSMFKIIAPGSYYLTDNIIGLVGKHGIEVAASGVTIDLNGFLLRGLGTIQGTFDGVHAAVGTERIIVKNGHIEVMGREGINLSGAAHSRVESITAKACLGSGIRIGNHGHVINCTSTQSTEYGIWAGEDSCIEACLASSNGLNGIRPDRRALIDRCYAAKNGGSGFYTIPGARVIGCDSRNNGQHGFSIGPGLISQCNASENAGFGFDAAAVALIHCSANSNNEGGVRASFGCLIYGNNCFGNNPFNGESAGILVTDQRNRIVSNQCTSNRRGIDIRSSQNIIIGNTCAGNTLQSWSIVANNYYGPIISRAGASTSAMSGNSATGTLNSTDPHANFTY